MCVLIMFTHCYKFSMLMTFIKFISINSDFYFFFFSNFYFVSFSLSLHHKVLINSYTSTATQPFSTMNSFLSTMHMSILIISKGRDTMTEDWSNGALHRKKKGVFGANRASCWQRLCTLTPPTNV